MPDSITALMTMRLPPALCGVGDYTWCLWHEWANPAPPWRFVVADGAKETAALPQGPEVRQAVASAGGVRTALNGVDTLGLMYTPYGYDKSGAPAWLAEGLTRWKQNGGRLVVMFHEALSSGPPWRRSFWKAPAQKRVIREIGALADVALTSTPRFQDRLSDCDIETRLCPVPSNVPRVDNPERSGERLRVVVFGLPQSRRKALRRHQLLIEELQRRDRLGKLIIVGAPAANAEATFVYAEKLKFTGELAPDAIAQTLANADLFLCAHPPDEVRKSGALAAALANGCPVAVRGTRPPNHPPALYYEEAEPTADLIIRETLDTLSKAGRKWYDANASWDVCLRVWKEAMGA